MPSGRQTAALGDALRQIRHEQGLTQEDLALRAGMHPGYVGGVERGERNPSWRSLTALASAAGVRTSAIVLRAEALAEEEGEA